MAMVPWVVRVVDQHLTPQVSPDRGGAAPPAPAGLWASHRWMGGWLTWLSPGGLVVRRPALPASGASVPRGAAPP
jgi:hypothetical protein